MKTLTQLLEDSTTADLINKGIEDGIPGIYSISVPKSLIVKLIPKFEKVFGEIGLDGFRVNEIKSVREVLGGVDVTLTYTRDGDPSLEDKLKITLNTDVTITSVEYVK